MATHTISHADQLFAGAAQAGGINQSRRGIKVEMVHQQVITTPITGDIDGLVTAAGAGATAPAGNVAIDGAFLSGGVGVINGPRNIVLASSNAGDTTQVLTITGTDAVGNIQVENITATGTTQAVGKKAFATVTSISNSAAFVGNLLMGTSTTLANIRFGLDAQMINIYDSIYSKLGTGAADAGTFIVADTTFPATAVTGDTKGTYTPAVAPNGTNTYVLLYIPRLTKDAYGENFTG